jgi:unsaturated rhamnogalacturonyl hydrolase
MNRTILEQHIDRVVAYTLNMDLTWDWPCGVAYYGITRAWEATGNREYLERLAAWADEYIETGLPEWTVNTCAMGHMLLSLYQETKEQKYLDIIKSKLDYLQNRALRFGEKVLQHTVSADNDFPEQCWADTLFMAAYFMLRAGILFDDKRLVEDALNQYYWHINYLQDVSTGLWYHGYNHVKRDHMSGVYWGRANAWAAYTMSRVRILLPQSYLYPRAVDVGGSLREQLAAVKSLQGEDGLWRTVLDDMEAYGEVSATAGIAAAMVTQDNPLHRKYIDKAMVGLLGNIAETGRVQNVSGGTAVMNDKSGYLGITKRWAQGWGQGLALTFLSALLEKLPESAEQTT